MHRLPGLDLLRAIAVAWVMLFHSFLVGGLGPDWEWLSRFGWMGVDIFFVLSGYLIGRQVLAPLAQDRPFSFGDFYVRRAFRILPAFLVVLAVYAALPGLREARGLAPLWQFATFTLNLVVDYGKNQAFSHAWSLCVEEHFYLLFPVLAVWLARRPSSPRTVTLFVVLVLAGIALRTGLWLHFDAMDPPRNWFVEEIYYPTYTRLDGLLAGVALAVLAAYRPVLWARLQAHGNAFLVLGLVTFALALWLFKERTGLLGNTIGWPVLSAAIACLVVAAAGPGSILGRAALPGAGWIATISYSLYLSHKLVFEAVDSGLGHWLEGRGALAFTVYALATLVGGAALHYSVERPFLRLRDRMQGRRRNVIGADETAAPLPAR